MVQCRGQLKENAISTIWMAKRAKYRLNDLLAKQKSSPGKTGHAEKEGDGEEDVGNQTEQD